MKKFCRWLFILITFIFCFHLCACTKEEELTEAEKSFVGTWTLDTITAYNSPLPKLWYPSYSSDFNIFCEQYIGRTSIIFESEKKDGRLSATLIVGDEETSFKWYSVFQLYEQPIPDDIYIDRSILPNYSANDTSHNLLISIEDNGYLCVRPGFTAYLFQKIK